MTHVSLDSHAVARPVLEAGRKLLAKGMSEYAASEAGQSALLAFAKAYGGSVMGETATEIMQEMTNIATEEVAKMASDGTFERLATSEIERARAIDRIVGIAAQTAGGMALLGLPGAGMAAHGQARANKAAAHSLAEAVAATRESKLAGRDPERFTAYVGRLAGGGTLHMPAESLSALYQSGVIDDATLEAMGIAEQMPEALAAGGDVLVEPARYLTAAARLTPEALVRMIDHTRPAPGDVTPALAKLPGQTEASAKAQAVLWRERMLQRARDRGMHPDALWAEEKPGILGPKPALPVDDIDLVLERLRSGREVQTARQPVLDIIRDAGGIKPGFELAQDLAAMGITPTTAPGLYRQNGIGSADRIVVAEHEVLRDNGVTADANGYADHNALMQAVGREWTGDPLQTQNERDWIVRLDEPVQALRAALEAQGIVPEFVDKADVLRLMAGDGALGQPVNAGVDPNRMVQVVDITGMFGKPRNDKSLVASLRSLVGQPLSTGDQGRIARMLPKHVHHVVHSGAPIRVQDKAVRSASVGGLTVLLAQAPLIESGPNTKTDRKPNAESYHPFYVPIWDGKTVRVLRIVAEQSKSGIVIDPKDFDIYDVVVESKRLPPSRSVPNGETASTPLQMGGQPQIATIRQMLSGVKDMRGKPYFQPDGGTWRGSYDPVTDTIRLFESANLSTFLHEGGHRWLFEMTGDLADHRLLPAARERITRDLQTVMDWLKIDIDVSKADPDQIKDALTVEAHETWARGVEAYLMEGKAPSAALAAVFARFRDWLIRIYRTVATLDAALSPEVRQVMDRLLASVEGQEGTERPHPSELVPVNSSEKG